MPVPPAPAPLEQLGSLPFSFDPAISGVEPNQWRYARSTWAEVLVLNARTGEEVAIPRRFIGAMSCSDDCAAIVSLSRRLEYRGGLVRPVEQRVIVMPAVSRFNIDGERAVQPAAVVPIRLDDPGRSLAARILLYAAALGMAGTVLFAYLYRGEIIDSRNTVRPPARAAQF